VWDLVTDNESVLGRLVTSAAVIVVAVAVGWLVGRIAAHRADDSYERYYARKVSRYVVTFVALVALAVVWRAFAGRAGVVLGLMAAGIAFAMQEVIGAVAGWFNIVWGRIFRVGDRIQMGGVRGDVIDVTPLRTKIMEIGSDRDDGSWVRGRQFTGRIVSVSNKATFTEPVFNYSAAFDYLWEELTVPIPYDADWHAAAQILDEEAVRISAAEGAAEAIAKMKRHYPLPSAEIQPRVFSRATDNYMELSARFVVPVRRARTVKDQLTRRVMERLRASGIPIASTTQDVTVDFAGGPVPGEGEAASGSSKVPSSRGVE
jgi:small-conductance mechanosensitive channel